MTGHTALVFGGSGMQGWSIVNQILRDYPTADSFDRVIVLTNRPLALASALWPESSKLQPIRSGIDLSAQQVQVQQKLRAIPYIADVDIVYFTAYTWHEDPDEESRINKTSLVNAITALEKLSPKLRFVVLPIGTKTYGVHMIASFPFSDQLPLKESLPRIPEPWASQLFYYHQVDALREMSAGKAWSYCELRPDIIVGFVPNGNFYNIAYVYAIYLSLYAYVEGRGAVLPFAGPQSTWYIRSNDSSQDVTAQFAIHASLHPDECAEQAINVADSDVAGTWAVRWPKICEYFGLVGAGPSDTPVEPSYDYIQRNMHKRHEMERQYDLKEAVMNEASWRMSDAVLSYLNFDRHLDVTKMRSLGYSPKGEQTVETAYWKAFDRYIAAGIIPKESRVV